MADDAEQLGQHDADDLGAVGHLDAGQLLHGQDVGQVVHHAAEVVDAVGVGNVGVPGLPLAHLLGAAVVEADVAAQRRRSPRRRAAATTRSTPCVPGWCGPTLRNMKSVSSPLPLHAPFLGSELQRLLHRRLLVVAASGTAPSRWRGRGAPCAADGPPTRAASGCGRRCGWPSKPMPNMSQTSRSYQFAAGQRSVTRGRRTGARPRAAP